MKENESDVEIIARHLKDLADKITALSANMEKGFKDVDERFITLEKKVDDGFEAINLRLDQYAYKVDVDEIKRKLGMKIID